MIDADKGGECVPLGCRVTFGLEESGDKVGRIWYQRRRVLVDGGYREDGILADIRMTVLEARSSGGKERLDQLRLAKLAEEAQCVAADILVGMLEIVSYAVAVGQTLSACMKTWSHNDE